MKKTVIVATTIAVASVVIEAVVWIAERKKRGVAERV